MQPTTVDPAKLEEGELSPTERNGSLSATVNDGREHHHHRHVPHLGLHHSHARRKHLDRAAHASAAIFLKPLNSLPKTTRGHVVAVIGEYFGTIAFLFFAFAGTQVANVSSNTNTGGTVITTTAQKTPQQLLYIALSFGFSLAVFAWTFARISGGLFNPAVTVGMWLIGAIDVVRMVLLFITQILGAITAAALVQALFTGGLNVATTLSETTSIAQGFFIEFILTAQLVFVIFLLAAEKNDAQFVAPVGIGLSLFIAELVGVFWTGGSLNPARSLAPGVITHSFETTQWIYWIAPLCGSFLAVFLYKLIKALEYETINLEPENPDQQRGMMSTNIKHNDQEYTG